MSATMFEQVKKSDICKTDSVLKGSRMRSFKFYEEFESNGSNACSRIYEDRRIWVISVAATYDYNRHNNGREYDDLR
jgi:hypothetical protein